MARDREDRIGLDARRLKANEIKIKHHLIAKKKSDAVGRQEYIAYALKHPDELYKGVDRTKVFERYAAISLGQTFDDEQFDPKQPRLKFGGQELDAEYAYEVQLTGTEADKKAIVGETRKVGANWMTFWQYGWNLDLKERKANESNLALARERALYAELLLRAGGRRSDLVKDHCDKE